MDNNYNRQNQDPNRPRKRKKVSKDTLRKRQLGALCVIAFIVLLMVIVIAKACSKNKDDDGGNTTPTDTTVTTADTTTTTAGADTTTTTETTTVPTTGSNDPNGFKLEKYSFYINPGETALIRVTDYPTGSGDANEVWKSSNPQIASVSADGYVTGVSGGECYVTVSSNIDPTQEATAKVVVAGNTNLSNTEDPNAEKDSDSNGNPAAQVNDPEDPNGNGKSGENGESGESGRYRPDFVKKAEEQNSDPVQIGDAPAPAKLTGEGYHYEGDVLIVNKSYSMPASYNPGCLDPTCTDWFYKLVAGAAKDGINIYLSSGFRSYDYQSQIYNNYCSIYGAATADTFSARPGNSEHQTGLAIDVNIIDDTFTGTPEAIWLENHCWEYGFIIRYPKGKQDITGYKYEPWHIRYVGTAVSKQIHDMGNNVTLEELYGLSSQYPS